MCDFCGKTEVFTSYISRRGGKLVIGHMCGDCWINEVWMSEEEKASRPPPLKVNWDIIR